MCVFQKKNWKRLIQQVKKVKKSKLKRGTIGYEKIVVGRIFGKWEFYDEQTKKKYGHLSKKELDKIWTS